MTATMKKIKLPREQIREARIQTHYLKYRKVLTRPGNFVPGVGSRTAKVMMIGESPGEEEDKKGEPFVGPAGSVLNRAIVGVLGMNRNDIFITNLIKFRPPGNDIQRVVDDVPPAAALMRWEIAIIRPRIVVPLGRWAAGLFFQNFSITEIAGQMYIKQGQVVVPMLHPSYVLRKRNHDEYKGHFQNLKKVIDDLTS